VRHSYILSYDLGTSGVKVSKVDLDGHIICRATENYSLYSPKDNWAEQDPEQYWTSVCAVTRRIISESGSDPKAAKAIVFGTQWKGIIPINENGKVLHNSIIWLDARAGKQADELNKKFGKTMFCAADYWPKLAWLKENMPEVYDNAEYILKVNSFLKWKATGVMASDVTNHFIRSFDPELQKVYDAFLSFVGMDINKFPKLIKSTDFVGEVTEEAAKAMGITPGVPVFGGCSDIAAISIGAGACERGNYHTYFGSSGWVGAMTKHDSSSIYLSPFDEKNDIRIFGVQAIGLSQNWCIEQLYNAEKQKMGDNIFSFVDEEVKPIPPGSAGLLATPWFYGERPPFFGEKARGVFFNLGSQHDRRYMINAIMEGVCYSLRMNREMLAEIAGRYPDSVNSVGGGACSEHWMQILADVLEIPVHVPENPRHAGAIGTAYCAMIGLGLCKDFTEAKQRIRIEKTFLPRENAKAEYRLMFDVYKKLYPTFKELFQILN
jgi:xylulokinase